MSCSDPATCPHGNCVGCKNGQIDCQDPRCAPYCPNCFMQPEQETVGNIMVIIILICLTAILFIVWFIYGRSLFETHSDHERAGVITTADSYKQNYYQ